MKKRIGLIVPSSNTVIEVDFYRNLPRECTLHVSRMFLEDTTVEGEEEMLDVHFPKALYDLATARPDIVVFGCTSAGALRGNRYDRELCTMIERVSGAESVSVIESVRKSLKKRYMKKVLVITPYVETLNKKICKSLEDDGIKVAGIYGLGIDHNHSIGMVEPGDIQKFVLEKWKEHQDDCDGIFVSCTNFRAMDALPSIERAVSIPVVSSNQAAFEAVLSRFGS